MRCHENYSNTTKANCPGPTTCLVATFGAASCAGKTCGRICAARTSSSSRMRTASSLLLNPGALGLVMLDSFVFGTPLVTCDITSHGPELAYLQPGRDGVLTANDEAACADKVVRLLRDPAALQ